MKHRETDDQIAKRKKFAILLHTTRIERGETVTGMAKKLGLNRTTFQAYEDARAAPNLFIGLKMCRILNLDTRQL